MKRKYSGSYSSNKVAKTIAKPKRYYSKGLIKRVFNTPVVYGKYANNSFKKGGEIKTLDSTFTGAYNMGTYTPDTIQTSPYQMMPINNGTGLIQSLNLCQQGAGISNRIGNKISMKSLRLRFNLYYTGKSLTYAYGWRYMVIYDRQPPTNYPATNTIISSINGGNVIVNGLMTDGINPNLMDRLVVLCDKKMCLPSLEINDTAASSLTGPTDSGAFMIDEYIKLRNMDVVYSGSNATMTLSYISTGALYFLVMADPNMAPNANDPFQLLGSARLRYHDN